MSCGGLQSCNPSIWLPESGITVVHYQAQPKIYLFLQSEKHFELQRYGIYSGDLQKESVCKVKRE